MDYNVLIQEVAIKAANEAAERIAEKFREMYHLGGGDTDRLIPLAEVAKRFSVTAQTLCTWHNMGYLKKHHVGRKVFYKAQDVENLWMAKTKGGTR